MEQNKDSWESRTFVKRSNDIVLGVVVWEGTDVSKGNTALLNNILIKAIGSPTLNISLKRGLDFSMLMKDFIKPEGLDIMGGGGERKVMLHTLISVFNCSYVSFSFNHPLL